MSVPADHLDPLARWGRVTEHLRDARTASVFMREGKSPEVVDQGTTDYVRSIDALFDELVALADSGHLGVVRDLFATMYGRAGS